MPIRFTKIYFTLLSRGKRWPCGQARKNERLLPYYIRYGWFELFSGIWDSSEWVKNTQNKPNLQHNRGKVQLMPKLSKEIIMIYKNVLIYLLCTLIRHIEKTIECISQVGKISNEILINLEPNFIEHTFQLLLELHSLLIQIIDLFLQHFIFFKCPSMLL